jgi:hypothetical protein
MISRGRSEQPLKLFTARLGTKAAKGTAGSGERRIGKTVESSSAISKRGAQWLLRRLVHQAIGVAGLWPTDESESDKHWPMGEY